ncbi:hypothetical protein KFE25_006522 [Diacronema lutheri]|uniref:AB hydrolase-1 domain-containing protein n=1 Tax=Diacronema lutheri TaxID=2081491 RepID=A0A8J6C1N1_DIALT|nr:hypothetical protein KFE25_006522 [Diacronema lutheri]
MPTVRARDGCRIFYELAGEDDGRARVVYCPSWGSDLRKVPSLAHSPLARSSRLLLFDLRGTGRSDRVPEPHWAAPPSMRILADDVEDLLDALGWRSAHVLGCSFGAQLALTLAARAPGRVASLALVNSHAGSGEAGGEADGGASSGAASPRAGVLLVEELEALSVAERTRRMIALADVRRDGAWFASAHGAALVRYAVEQEEVLAHSDGADSAARERTGAPFAPGYVEGRAWLLRARRGYDARADLARIGARLAGRLLVVASRFDGLVPEGGPQALHAGLAAGAAAARGGAELALMDAGHWPSVTADPAFWPRVVAFFATHHSALSTSVS